MPLHQRINLEEETQFLIWHIDEAEDELLKDLNLSKIDELKFQKKKNTSHRKEFLAARKLLREAGIAPQTLRYSPDGAPQLESGRQLSISHSNGIAGIALGDKPLGFDLEEYRPKIVKIAPRFLHSKEVFTNQPPFIIEKLTLIWTAKEALYKALNQKGIVFSQQLCVAPFEWGDKWGSAKVFMADKTLNFCLNFILEKEYCGTLATPIN